MVNKINDDLNSASKGENLEGGVPGIIIKESDISIEQRILDAKLSKDEFGQFAAEYQLELKTAFLNGREYKGEVYGAYVAKKKKETSLFDYLAFVAKNKKAIFFFEWNVKDEVESYILKAYFS